MSQRRRRQTEEENSVSDHSENSANYKQSDSESEQEDPTLPTYEDALKLVSEETPVSKKTPNKISNDVQKKKQDPAFVPRSDRFFLHDNREDDAKQTGGRGGVGSSDHKSKQFSPHGKR
jgi:hypothetical protein